MKKLIPLLIPVAAAALLAACQSTSSPKPDEAVRATAALQPTKGSKAFGEATFEQVGDKVRVIVFAQGLKADESKTFDVTFPEDYHGKDVAGKTATFTVHVTKIEEPKLPALDAEFARQLGVADGDLEKMRVEVRANVEREVKKRVNKRLEAHFHQDFGMGVANTIMAAAEGVVEVHDLHVWEVTSGMPAISAHMIVGSEVDCHQARWQAARLLADRFGVEHSTLQVEHEPGDELLQISPH